MSSLESWICGQCWSQDFHGGLQELHTRKPQQVLDSLGIRFWQTSCRYRGMRKTLLGLLLAGSAAFAQFSIGVRIGPPPAPRVIHARPHAPGPDYFWVDGYWYPEGGRYRWHNGYWTRPPYAGAQWIGPRYDGGEFFSGYWEGGRGRVDHDHRWDRDRNRDFGRDRRDDRNRRDNKDGRH